MSITFPTEEADVTVALVSFIGPTPIASPWSNAIPIDVKCAWRHEDIAEESSLVVKKSTSALRVFVTQLKDIKACVDDGMLVDPRRDCFSLSASVSSARFRGRSARFGDDEGEFPGQKRGNSLQSDSPPPIVILEALGDRLEGRFFLSRTRYRPFPTCNHGLST